MSLICQNMSHQQPDTYIIQVCEWARDAPNMPKGLKRPRIWSATLRPICVERRGYTVEREKPDDLPEDPNMLF